MSKEKVYDEQISPLMAKIVKICHENNIAVICNFALDKDPERRLSCTTAILTEESDPSEEQMVAADVLCPRKYRPTDNSQEERLQAILRGDAPTYVEAPSNKKG